MNITTLRNAVNGALKMEQEHALSKAEKYIVVGEEILTLEASFEKVREAKAEILASYSKGATKEETEYLGANYSQFKSVARGHKWLSLNRKHLASNCSCEMLIELDHLINTEGGGKKAMELTKNKKKPSVREIREAKKSLKPDKSGKLDKKPLEENHRELINLVLKCRELIENSEEECAGALADWMIDHVAEWSEEA